MNKPFLEELRYFFHTLFCRLYPTPWGDSNEYQKNKKMTGGTVDLQGRGRGTGLKLEEKKGWDRHQVKVEKNKQKENR